MMERVRTPPPSDEPSMVPTPDGASTPPPFPVARWYGDHLGEVRWQAELARLAVSAVYRGRGVPRGDGRAVLTIPGFMAGDPSLAVLNGWLRRIGYAPRRSGILVNVDCSDRAIDRLERRLLSAWRQSGRRVAVLGHSRGGHFAKVLAGRHPDKVACVVSMGAGLDAPFAISVPTQRALAAVRAAHVRRGEPFASNGCLTEECSCAFVRDYIAPFPSAVPLTSIYSRRDGVVWWEACLTTYGRNVEVRSSHVGLAFNRHAYAAIATALVAPADR
jgi:pimeloyl-ACP methyl ester carboxylesterase